MEKTNRDHNVGKLIFWLFFLLSSPSLSIGQHFQLMDVPVFKNGQPLTNPWTGGMNAPQWASFDINGDGQNDLYAFDRTGDIHLSFIRVGDNNGMPVYKYSRQWLKNFPYVRYFVLMRDYNLDGTIDLFCSAYDELQRGIRAYTGRRENGLLFFDKVAFPENAHDVIPYSTGDTAVESIPIYLNTDYPALDDLDGDGDLDFLTVNITGDKVHFFKNTAIESGLTADSLRYELADDCWGRFGLLPNASALSTSLDPNLCAFFSSPTGADDRLAVHGGTTLCTFDQDNDGDKEILYGDLISRHIIYGKNNGDTDNAWVTEQDTMFPAYDTSIDIPFFCAPFYLDINDDGAGDLLASPNQIWQTPDRETAWFYENTGTAEWPVFNLVQKDFLGETMLDFGTGASPVFVDVNADGLLDIVAGNRYFWTDQGEVSALFLLKNIGTENEPAFEWADSDWLGLSQFSPDLNTLTPAFGDLDSDGDQDLLLGDRWGHLHYAENIAGAGAPMQFGPIVFNWKNINVGQIATPFIHDINRDGLQDLIVGELKGTVNYFPNTGTPSNPVFHPVAEEFPNNDFFGKINTQPIGSTVGYTQPHIVEFGDTMYLISGSFRGWIKRYLINPDSLDHGAFDMLEEEWDGLREGSASRIAFANLDNDGFLDAVVGNDRGGLTLFRSPLTTNGTTTSVETFSKNDPSARIYPNPSSDELRVIVSEKTNISVYDIFGRQLHYSEQGPGTTKMDVSHLPTGTYIVILEQGLKKFSEKIIIHR